MECKEILYNSVKYQCQSDMLRIRVDRYVVSSIGYLAMSNDNRIY